MLSTAVDGRPSLVAVRAVIKRLLPSLPPLSVVGLPAAGSAGPRTAAGTDVPFTSSPALDKLVADADAAFVPPPDPATNDEPSAPRASQPQISPPAPRASQPQISSPALRAPGTPLASTRLGVPPPPVRVRRNQSVPPPAQARESKPWLILAILLLVGGAIALTIVLAG